MRHFVPFVLLLLVVAVVLRVELLFTVVYFLVAASILARIWIQRTRAGLTLRRDFIDRAFLGDEVEVRVQVRNGSRLPIPWLKLTESVPSDLRSSPVPAQVLTVRPHGSAGFSYRVQCRKRGYHPLGPIRVEIGDVLGIESNASTWDQRDRLLVYPRVLPLDRLGLLSLSAQAALPAASALQTDPARVVGVREYVAGDSPRSMHWTASARSSRLLVKQYQPAIERETVICLNLNGRDYGQRHRNTAGELAITAAASLAHHILLRERLPVGLMTLADDPLAERSGSTQWLEPRSEHSHLLAILEVLARVQMTMGGDFVEALRGTRLHLPWGATVLVITGTADDNLLQTLLLLRRSGFSVFLALVRPEADGVLYRAAAGIPTYTLWNERDIEAWR